MATQEVTFKINANAAAAQAEFRKLAVAATQGQKQIATANKQGASSAAKMETLHICGGRKDKLRPGDILGALTGEAGGLNADAIGKIEIHDRYSYVAVSREVAKVALERLQQGRIKGTKFRVYLAR